MSSAGQAQSSIPLSLDPAAHVAAAAGVNTLAGEGRLPTHAPSAAAAAAEPSHASNELNAAVDPASVAPSSELAHAAAPAGPDEDNDDQQKGICCHGCMLFCHGFCK